ncbi:MAG: dihydrofolate reductase [Candidatus Magasanikbacteria bacterium]
MPFSLIVAVAKNNCIGAGNKLPWNIPEDLKHFKDLTLGKTCLMGQTTLDSIIGYLGKPLPGRKTVVLTKDKSYQPPANVRVFYSLDEAFEKLKNEDVFVCGGASIYAQTINRVDTLYITHVDKIVDGDAFFPEIDKNIWHETAREDHEGFSFVTYRKITPNT